MLSYLVLTVFVLNQCLPNYKKQLHVYFFVHCLYVYLQNTIFLQLNPSLKRSIDHSAHMLAVLIIYMKFEN